MTNITSIIDKESGIQYQGVEDRSSRRGLYSINGLIIGQFRRGRFDKPMTITDGNIRSQLGYDPKNPHYVAVQDVLSSGVPSVQVLRVNNESPSIDPQPPKDEHEIELFDYAVVRYIWEESGGLDLDTRTLVIDPPRNIAVGWGRFSNDDNFLHWVGDNTSSGVESVLIDMSSLRKFYPNQKNFVFWFKSFWYSVVNSGNFKLQVETYKGGQMVINNEYNYQNVDGQLLQNLTMDCQVGKSQSSEYEGFLVAQLTLNIDKKKGELVKKVDSDYREISFTSSSGITIFRGDLKDLELSTVSNHTLFNGSNLMEPLIIRNSSNVILFEK
ncbi:hypothetical protein N5C97_08660 [Acinetobacter johnsonii]|uniref:Uncharacterized protein n=1 Tax=Acinetobacter johnsonii TaxID=40214 RepID=A0AA42MA24_ACIJO|nr:hypothetical protein [Acinetobacter johnsonii]MDH0826570.1 hypothetical protein [Acinetobacter johnsonii]